MATAKPAKAKKAAQAVDDKVAEPGAIAVEAEPAIGSAPAAAEVDPKKAAIAAATARAKAKKAAQAAG